MKRAAIEFCTATLVLGLLPALPAQAFAGGPRERDEAAEVLESIGVMPTREGVEKFLRALVEGEHRPLTGQEAAALIAQLGSDEFEVRERATKKLQSSLDPPLTRLQEAARHNDPEIARRAQHILAGIAARPDPGAAACRLIQQRRLKVSPSLLLRFIEGCEGRSALEAAQDALAGLLGPGDRDTIRTWLDDKNPRIQATGVVALGMVARDDPVLELKKWLTHDQEQVRSAAARVLVAKSRTVDFQDYARVLDAESLALVLRVAERQFRHQNQDKRTDAGVMKDYEKLLSQYAEALQRCKGIQHARQGPANDLSWLEMGMDTSKRPDVLLYRVRWFSGQWSPWFVPGFNDRLNDPRNLRCWACFNDHEFEIIIATQKDSHREILDLP
jgi:uncharacterized protein (DUF934 family)